MAEYPQREYIVRETEYPLGYTKEEEVCELVRCKDCKYWNTIEGFNLSKRLKFCTYHIGHQYVRHDEDFCSRGERKDGEQA